MPIYEYRCDACGHEFEKLQKLSADPLRDCPECETDSLKKLISAAGFRLKGSGWYETDFKGGNTKNLHASDNKEKSAKKTDSKEGPQSKPAKPAVGSKSAGSSSGAK